MSHIQKKNFSNFLIDSMTKKYRPKGSTFTHASHAFPAGCDFRTALWFFFIIKKVHLYQHFTSGFVFRTVFMCLQFVFVIFGERKLSQKNVHKMLMKLSFY